MYSGYGGREYEDQYIQYNRDREEEISKLRVKVDNLERELLRANEIIAGLVGGLEQDKFFSEEALEAFETSLEEEIK